MSSEGGEVSEQEKPCVHENFDVVTRVVRVTRSDEDPTVIGWRADVHVACMDCKEAFVFLGLPVGMVADRPTVSADGKELRAVIAPESLVKLLKQTPAEPPSRIHLPPGVQAPRKLDT